MISGYLLLSRNYDSVDLKKFITKRFSRIFIPFCILVILYALIKGWSFSETLSRAINQKVEFHLWYVYSIIGIYLFLPIFLPLFSEKNIKIVRYYLVMWAVVQEIIPIVNPFLIHKILIFNNFNFYYFFGYLGWVLLGGYVAFYCKEKSDEKEKSSYSLLRLVRRDSFWGWSTPFVFVLFLIFLTTSLSIFGATCWYSRKVGAPTEIFFYPGNPLVLLQTLSFFLLFCRVKKTNIYLEKLAINSYWIYLIHILCLAFPLSILNLT